MPSRGEVWLVDLGLAQKVRPAVVISRHFSEQDRALITLVPHVTTLRGSAFEIRLPVPFLKEGAFLVQSPVTIPAVKAERFLGKLSAQQMALIEAGVREWLAL